MEMYAHVKSGEESGEECKVGSGQGNLYASCDSGSGSGCPGLSCVGVGGFASGRPAPTVRAIFFQSRHGRLWLVGVQRAARDPKPPRGWNTEHGRWKLETGN